MNLSTRFARAAAEACLGAAMLAIAPPANAAETVRGGLWEYTARLEGAAGSRSLVRKLTCQPRNWFHTAAFDGGPVAGCSSEQLRRLSDGYAWELRCEGRGRGSIEFKRLGRERVALDLAMEGPEGAFLLRAESRRIGECGDDRRLE